MSLLAIHVWIAFVDGIKNFIKKLFHLEKKKLMRWHTLDEKNQTKSEDVHKVAYIHDKKDNYL